MFNKAQEEPISNLPDLPDDYFAITDKQTIDELELLYKNNEDKSTFKLNGGNDFKLNQMTDALDQIRFQTLDQQDIFEFDPYAQNPTYTPFKNFDYYNLSNVEYNHQLAVMEVTQQGSNEMDLLNKKVEAMDLEMKQPSKIKGLTKQLQLLSFQDKED